MRRILVLFAHPVLERSRVNRRLVDAIRDLDGVMINDLYQRYPTLDLDVEHEHELLDSHDVVIFQHPFFWYSAPAIMKEWQDLVLGHGWAYGRNGTHLRGKITMNAITTGAPQEAYDREGYNHYSVRELLAPWEQTAHLCGMHYLAPFVVHGALKLAGDDDTKIFTDEYRRLLEALRDDKVDIARAVRAKNLALDPDFEFITGAREALA